MMKVMCQNFIETNDVYSASQTVFMEPHGLVRFLKARDFDRTKAFEMYQKWVNWRIDYKVDQLDPMSIKSLLLKETIILHGHDKSNRFCIVVRPRFHVPGA